MSLRAWLMAGTAGLLAIVIAGLEIPLAINLQHRSIAEFRSQELGHAGLLAADIADPVAHASELSSEAPHPGQDLERAVDEAARQAKARILVLNVHRRLIADSADKLTPASRVDISGRPELQHALDGRIESRQRHSRNAGQDLLVVAVPVLEAGHVVGAVRVSAPLSDVQGRVHRNWRNLALGGLGAMALGLALTWILATTVTRPVRRLRETAGRLAGGDQHARTAPGGPADIADLGRSFNRMAGALVANAAAQRDFLANAAHQLQTPLTGLRLRLDHIQGNRSDTPEQAAKASAEIDRLSALVTDLLVLTRASSQETAGELVDLREHSQTAAERWRETASRAGKTLREAGGQTTVWADPDDLELLVDALIDNAIRYCPAGTTITLEASRRGTHGVLAIADDGPGIPPEDRTRIFERFYRGAEARRLGRGSGLGLAIVSELARRWDAAVELKDDNGTRIEIRFPPPPRRDPLARHRQESTTG